MTAEFRCQDIQRREKAERARAMEAAAQAAPVGASFMLPPEDWKDRDSYLFLSFVLEYNTDNCLTCGSVNHWSNVYRAFGKRGHDAANYRRLVPTEGRISDKAPVVIFSKPPRSVPICHHCLTGDRSGSAFLVSSEEAWNEAVRKDREHRMAASASSHVSAPKVAPAYVGKKLEDLL
jgi:hypothetical protein